MIFTKNIILVVINSSGEQKDRNVLYNMLLDIDNIDSNIVYDNFYLNYFKKEVDICPQMTH